MAGSPKPTPGLVPKPERAAGTGSILNLNLGQSRLHSVQASVIAHLRCSQTLKHELKQKVVSGKHPVCRCEESWVSCCQPVEFTKKLSGQLYKYSIQILRYCTYKRKTALLVQSCCEFTGISMDRHRHSCFKFHMDILLRQIVGILWIGTSNSETLILSCCWDKNDTLKQHYSTGALPPYAILLIVTDWWQSSVWSHSL